MKLNFRRIPLFVISCFMCTNLMADVLQWQPLVLNFQTSESHSWSDFPMYANFIHEESGTLLVLDAFWNGVGTWSVRFAPTKPGKWTYTTTSGDPALNKHSGTIQCVAPDNSEIEENPNYHGQIKAISGKRYFEYADGTPVLSLAEQFWDFNVSGWMHIDDVDTYLKNRRAKGFNIVQMRFCRINEKNEGGYAFADNTGEEPGNGNFKALNPEYFHYLDQRFDYCFDQGFMVAGHPFWIGTDTKMTLEDARLFHRYILARYGAYNMILSLSGEFDKNFHEQHRDLAWVKEIWNNGGDYNELTDPQHWRELGAYVDIYNPYGVPMSSHPGWHRGDRYSSGDYLHDQEWLDHNWIQTYKSLHKLPLQVYQDYTRNPVKPVFFSEGIREGDQTEDIHVGAYGMRWEAWQSYLSGAAIHTYRHYGVYMEKWHDQGLVGPLMENLGSPGSSQTGLVAEFLRTLDWQSLVPARQHIRIDGRIPPYPTDDVQAELDKAVTMAADIGTTYVVYIPKNNQGETITIHSLDNQVYTAGWLNPRDGSVMGINNGKPVNTDENETWNIPERPDNDDWVVFLQIYSG